ncbi:MAG: bifunctional diaminohydroxyphosphoribosylaminopyrimidine deaminase/5-amino-6-(5-phosphoribosylamino)uracil reductase RibD [Candidatus Abyssobacteria bacterium SURF_17]|uniref:Riboflavin biosynthesis protein RibD n=1 Tax=Candidatus Abyssobacteria bacterium SURF_17 TaxID=2093361 RepID=A0A419EVM6_9BACT|nr:MAG: bifunctional diaminohydroxyphosphoribosylaminopyrimidine deaminase/5-amino-6-(5-phosphoribosylamino)uracil reductase RibD [Candidatus Abyssubacteria bacterium SURF_17]
MASEWKNYMERALELAELGRGFASPNPMVGAVLVKGKRIIAEGFHKRFGEAHAEIVALKNAGDSARGSTLCITLEPCCHHGKTPPCTRAIIEAGVKQVVMAMEDPNPLVAGMGRKELDQAGIRVECGLLADRARKLNESFVKFITTGLPFFTAKAAMTLDGKIATRTGDSRWITGEQAREYVHWLRAGVDAVMVGSGTVEADDPMLTTRTTDTNERDAARVIVDGDAKLSPNRKVFTVRSSAPTLVVVKATASADRKEALRRAGAELIEVTAKGGKVDLAHLASLLGKRNIAHVMIEGGGGLLAAAFDAGIVDKVLFFVAPKIFGGKDASTPVEGIGVTKASEAISLRDVTTRRMGDDILIEGYVST